MGKFTPGPWTLRDAKYAKGIVSEMRFVIECNTNIPEVKNTVALVGYKPNANLCVAAPELLEALKLFVQFFDEMPKGQLGRISCDIGILNNAFLKSSKAIAKAEPKEVK